MKVMDKARSTCCGSYKLILMDINMPVMDGVQASNILKEKINNKIVKSVPIIAISGETMTEDQKAHFFAETGFTEFITKPIKREEFINLLVKHNIIF